MIISDNGLTFLEHREAKGGQPNLVAYKPLDTDVWTIGYGHTKGVYEGQRCGRWEAVAWLNQDVGCAELDVKQTVRVELTQSEYDALVSLIYNVGLTEWADSHALTCLNNYDRTGFCKQAFDPVLGFVRSGGHIIPGLVTRRELERDIFMHGIYNMEGPPANDFLV